MGRDEDLPFGCRNGPGSGFRAPGNARRAVHGWVPNPTYPPPYASKPLGTTETPGLPDGYLAP